MRRIPVLAIAVIARFLVAPGAGGVDQKTTPDEGKDQAIRELMQMTGSAALSRQVMEQILPSLKRAIPDVPEPFWEEFMAEIRMDDLVDLIVPIYAKHFTRQEVEQLIAFYKTPLGKKVIAEMPMVMQECMLVGQEWGRGIAERAQRKANARSAATSSR